MGRPPGALSGKDGRRSHPQIWEFREHDAVPYYKRLEDADGVDDEEEDVQDKVRHLYGTPGACGSRLKTIGTSPDTDFGNLGLVKESGFRGAMYDQTPYDDYNSEDYCSVSLADVLPDGGEDFTTMLSALERISEAKSKGHANVNLTLDEIKALSQMGSGQTRLAPRIRYSQASPSNVDDTATSSPARPGSIPKIAHSSPGKQRVSRLQETSWESPPVASTDSTLSRGHVSRNASLTPTSSHLATERSSDESGTMRRQSSPSVRHFAQTPIRCSPRIVEVRPRSTSLKPVSANDTEWHPMLGGQRKRSRSGVLFDREVARRNGRVV